MNKINYLERRVLDDARPDKRNNDGHNVDRELKLQKFGNTIVHVPAPHDSLHDTAEVVVGQDDVGSLLGDVGTGDTLKIVIKVKKQFTNVVKVY